MGIYYRDETVVVSSTHLTVGDQRYPLERLGYVWHRNRRFHGRGHLRTRMLATALLGVGVLVGVVALLITIDFGRYRWYVLTAAALVGTVLAALAGFGVDPVLEMLDRGHEHGRGTCEIWARVDGAPVLLFTTTDGFRFGKVYRSLQRAFEQRAPTPAPAQAARAQNRPSMLDT